STSYRISWTATWTPSYGRYNKSIRPSSWPESSNKQRAFERVVRLEKARICIERTGSHTAERYRRRRALEDCGRGQPQLRLRHRLAHPARARTGLVLRGQLPVLRHDDIRRCDAFGGLRVS